VGQDVAARRLDRAAALRWPAVNTHAIPERVVQLCHPDLHNEFPPLRLAKTIVAHNLPAQLTSFVGRGAQIKDVQQILSPTTDS
jgi:hypothetical protein